MKFGCRPFCSNQQRMQIVVHSKNCLFQWKFWNQPAPHQQGFLTQECDVKYDPIGLPESDEKIRLRLLVFLGVRVLSTPQRWLRGLWTSQPNVNFSSKVSDLLVKWKLVNKFMLPFSWCSASWSKCFLCLSQMPKNAMWTLNKRSVQRSCARLGDDDIRQSDFPKIVKMSARSRMKNCQELKFRTAPVFCDQPGIGTDQCTLAWSGGSVSWHGISLWIVSFLASATYPLLIKNANKM